LASERFIIIIEKEEKSNKFIFTLRSSFNDIKHVGVNDNERKRLNGNQYQN